MFLPPEYRIDLIVGVAGSEPTADDYVRAAMVANAVRSGEGDVTDFRPAAYRGNLGIPRSSMPQLPDKPLAELAASKDAKDRRILRSIRTNGGDGSRGLLWEFVDYLRDSHGVETTLGVDSPRYLRATQREMKAEKVLGMVDSYYKGEFDLEAVPLIVSQDGYVLDGHHRWAAMLIVDPSGSLRVWKIGLPIRELLVRAHDYPGVFRFDIDDQVVGPDVPLDLAWPLDYVWCQRGRWFVNSGESVKGPFKMNPKIARIVRAHMERRAVWEDWDSWEKDTRETIQESMDELENRLDTLDEFARRVDDDSVSTIADRLEKTLKDIKGLNHDIDALLDKVPTKLKHPDW